MTITLFALILVSMALTLVRVLEGPTVFDRVMVMNMLAAKTVSLLLLLALFTGNEMVIDIALIYTLINFVTTVALLKYFKYGTLGDPHEF